MFLVAAIASLCSAVTTAILVYGPGVQAGADAVSQAQLHANWLYLYKPWVLFFHPQFALVASLGIGFALFSKHPAYISIGLFYLLIWAVTEMTQQAYVIDALNQYWRPGFLNAAEATEKAEYATLLRGFSGISDSQYFVLLFGFGVGTTLFGIAFLSTDILGKTIGVILVFIGLLSVTSFVGYYAGVSAVTPITSWIYSNLYGVIQTGVRIAMGIWLWRIYVVIRPAE
jgi:hypothetical protein